MGRRHVSFNVHGLLNQNTITYHSIGLRFQYLPQYEIAVIGLRGTRVQENRTPNFSTQRQTLRVNADAPKHGDVLLFLLVDGQQL